MSVDTPSTRSTRKANNDAKFVEYDDYIDTHIRNTRRAVKLIDLATSLVLLATGVLSYLLVAAVAEHWLVPGGYPPAVRMLLFALLVGGVGYFAYRNLWPLCWRAINPVYAAQAIEQNSPSLKNSLINFLLFRQRRSDISDAVYHTLEEQAAQRLTRVPMDGAVDRTLLIRFGYVLIGIVAIAALYKVLSPKDPFVSAERVLMPWADIVPASRVTIRAVEPGIATVSRGESLDVSADVRGIDDDDPVRLLFTTDDGQTVDKPIAMRLSSDGLRFEGRLPDNARGAQQVGLTRNLKYRIEAGDARSLDYPVTVVAAPTLLVERIDYDYPAYTGFVDRKADDLGDIRAIEGTRITIHARANDPIKQAHVDFDADGRRDLDMKASEQQATATFELSLRDDRHTPTHASYVLRLTNTDGRTNRDPVKHSINVDPDQSPEATIVAPEERLVDVRLDDKVEIEAEASDPDFKLSAVRLRGEVAGRLAIDEPLLAAEHRGRFTGKYTFAPSAHKMQAGEILDYWVEASDNRAPKANVTASDHKQIRIASPQPNQQPPPDQVAQNDRQPKDGGQQQDQPGQQGEKKDSGGNNSKGGGEQQPGGATGKSPSDNSEGKNGEQQQSGNQPSNGDKNQSPGRDAKRSEGQGQGDKETGKQGEKQSGDQKNEKSDGKAGEGKSGEKNQQGDTAKAGDQKSPQDSSDKQTGAGAAGGESSKGESQPDGTRPDAPPGQQQQSGNGQSGKQQSGESAKESPVSSQGDNDAEAFQRIREHMKRQGELKDDDAKSSESQDNAGDNKQPFSRDAKQSEKQGQGDKETGKQEESNDPSQQQKQGEQQPDAKGDQKANPADQKQNATPSDEKNSQEQPGNTNSDQAKGSGASTRKDDTGKAKEPAGEKPDDSQSPSGEQTSSKGSSGAGEEQKDSAGSPNSQPNTKPTEKREQSPSGDEQSKDTEPPAGARGKKESDSQGEQGGDKPGGGEEGGSQKSPHDGTGSAGQNQSADEGAGQSGEQGTGKNSSSAGKDATSDKRTGQPGGETYGRGSKTREGEGDKPGGKSGAENDPSGKANQTSGDLGKQTSDGDKKQSSDPGSKQSPNSDGKQSADQAKTDKETGRQGDKEQGKQESGQGDHKGDQQQSAQGEKADQSKGGGSENNPGNKGSSDGKQPGEATGGGESGTAAGEPPKVDGTAPEGDAANLDYARKQTDLVLDKLASQVNTKKVDERLLKELGWTEDDLRKFVARWQSRKTAAERDDASGENARRELDDALRSLGLRPGTLKQGPVKDDTMRDVHEGYHGPVPQKYRDQLRAYNEGVSRARQNGE